jgi:lysozyme
MFDRRRFLIGAGATLSFVNCKERVTAAPTSWVPLTADVSRSDQFHIELVANIRDYGPLTTQIQESNALDLYFNFPDDVKYDHKVRKPRNNTHFGIDISHWQPDIDVSRLRSQGVNFLFHKASQGVRGYDPTFRRNWQLLSELSMSDRLPKGAYHFLTPDEKGADQAEHYFDVVASSGGWAAGDLVPVVDVEWTTRDPSKDAWRRKSPTEIVTTISDFLTRIHQKLPNSRPIIYTGRSWWSVVEPRQKTTELRLPEELASYRLWIADYGRNSRENEIPSILSNASAILWQFTNTASVSTGYDGNLDATVFYGTDDEFTRALTITP